MTSEGMPDYYRIFGLPVSFDIDSNLIAERYRELQRAVHPDRFASAGDRERREAVVQAANINEAYQTLKSPLRRARYLLQLRGVAFDDEKETTFVPEFLMEQMELREALAEVRGQSDAFAALTVIIDDINQRIAAMLDAFQRALDGNDLAEAKQIVQKLQFLNKLKQESEDIEAELADAL